MKHEVKTVSDKLQLPMDGERYIPGMGTEIELEHLHRYRVATRFAAGRDILDIASGEGYGSAILASAGATSVVGVDISEDAVAYARQRYAAVDNLRFEVGECAHIPLPDASIDLVVSFETIEHHDQHREMLSEIARILRPDGVLVMSSPNRVVYSEERSYQNPFHVRELDREEFRSLLDSVFSHVTLCGQSIFAGSIMIPLDGGPHEEIGFANLAQADAGTMPWMYFVAICSRSRKEAIDASSLFNTDHDPLMELHDAGASAPATVTVRLPDALCPPPRPVAARIEGDVVTVDDVGYFKLNQAVMSGYLDLPSGDAAEPWYGWSLDQAASAADAILVMSGSTQLLLVPCYPRPDIAAAAGKISALLTGFVVPPEHQAGLDPRSLTVIGLKGAWASALVVNGPTAVGR